MATCYIRIRNLREDNDLKQRELAEILGCSQRVYSNYERGDLDIPTDILIGLARYYNTSVDYLLGLTNQKEAYHPADKAMPQYAPESEFQPDIET